MDKTVVSSSNLTLIEQQKIRKQGIQTIIVFLIIFSIILVTYYLYAHQHNEEHLLDEQIAELDEMQMSIQNNMKEAASPLIIFNRSETAKQLLLNEDDRGRELFNDMFLAYIQEVGVYQQIRLINDKGIEIVRVDRFNDGSFEVVRKEDLQDKSKRYYFNETIEMPPNFVYLSPFDLNIENGQIEIPYKPMIRIGKTYESEDKIINGMMILNVQGEKLLDDIGKMNKHASDILFMLNSDGYYLYSDDEDKNFAFMFPKKKDIGFFSDYEDVWAKILNDEMIIGSDAGNFYARRMYLLDPKYYRTNEDFVYLVMHVPKSEINRIDNELIKFIILSSLFLLPLASLIGWYIGATRARNIIYKNRLERNAARDNLTGLYNHRMIIQLLNHAQLLAKRSNETLTIAFVDVNNLKYINDNFGHTMGDKMIVAAADALTNSVRNSDFVSRFGGDEFLLVLPNCSEENSNKIMKKAYKLFIESGVQELNMPWIMSYGCVKFNGTESITEFIHRADALMYENKKMSKMKK